MPVIQAKWETMPCDVGFPPIAAKLQKQQPVAKCQERHFQDFVDSL